MRKRETWYATIREWKLGRFRFRSESGKNGKVVTTFTARLTVGRFTFSVRTTEQEYE